MESKSWPGGELAISWSWQPWFPHQRWWSWAGRALLGLAPHQLLMKAVSVCVSFLKTWRHGVPPSPNLASNGCMALTLVVLVAIQKDSSEGGGITWVLNGPMDEVWGAVQPICQLSWYGWELTLLSQGHPQPGQIPISLAMKGRMGPQDLLGGRDV